jgi:hypothetical protein
MLREKFLRALTDKRVFLVPGGYSPKGVTKVRVYIINELNEIERVNIETELWNNKSSCYTLLSNSSNLNPIFLLLSAICKELNIDVAEINQYPPIL